MLRAITTNGLPEKIILFFFSVLTFHYYRSIQDRKSGYQMLGVEIRDPAGVEEGGNIVIAQLGRQFCENICCFFSVGVI